MLDITATKLLIGGGLVAGVTAAWGHIKSTASRLSTYLVIKATFNPKLSLAVVAYLKANYRQVPTGTYVFDSRLERIKVQGTTAWLPVPYRVLDRSVIFWKGKTVLFVTVDNILTIRSLRGMVDFHELLNAALDMDADRTLAEDNNKKKHNSFFVRTVIGLPKNKFSLDVATPRAGRNQSEGESTSRDETTFHGSIYLDVRYDTSFRYGREHFAVNREDPFAGLFYPDHIMREVSMAKEWLNSASWYRDRLVPWRKGWLLWGPGGTGKSSLVRATASYLGIPVIHYYLATLSDQEFMEAWADMPTPCIALFEDFDNVFHGRENQTEHKSLTFDCILNTISGVTAIEGVFLAVTTNHLEYIDEAMGVSINSNGDSSRPGRIDRVLYLGPTEVAARNKIAQKILRDWPDELAAMTDYPEDVTADQFRDLCVQRAQARKALEHSQ